MEAIAQTQDQAKAQRKPISQQPIVKRMVGFKEIHGNTRRVGTIMYEYNRETRTLRYGASIFRTSADKPEPFVRANHLKTAANRFEKHPVIVENFADDSTLRDFNERLRQLLFKYRCRSFPEGHTSASSNGSNGSNHSMDNHSTDSQ